ncbi:MAG: SPOR domain-containing protein [Flavobacteriaceae bacterium]|nr:SPOR domain-containing protein [Flavobacteriaceae bacterium]
MKRLLIITLLSLPCVVFSQSQVKKIGKIQITEEKGVATLLNANTENLQGYRVQVFSGNANEREKAQNIATTIENEHNVKAYVEYEQPHFKVRVGNFIDKIEAIKLKHKLAKSYPNTYIVRVKEIKL